MGESNIQMAINEVAALVRMYGPGTAPVKHGTEALRFLDWAGKEMDALRDERDGLRELSATRLDEIETLRIQVHSLTLQIEEAQADMAAIAVAATTVLPVGQEPQESLDAEGDGTGPRETAIP